MRNYTNTLLFESALDSILPSRTQIKNAAFNLFNPRVRVVSQDCSTKLGTSILVNFKAEGEVELSNETRLTRTRLNTLGASGKGSVFVRSLSSCIEKEGVCKKCLVASRPRLSAATTGSVVQISPELQVDVTQITLNPGVTTAVLPYSPDQYDVIYLYRNGQPLDPSSYTISDRTLTLNAGYVVTTELICKFYVTSNVAYYYWLAGTYSGSLLGLKPLLEVALPVKPSLYHSTINRAEIDGLVRSLQTSGVSDQDSVQYIPRIKDPLEKAVFVVTLASIFLN